jgi:hypothetical protein
LTPKLAISVSYYGHHRKGDGQVMDAWEHEDMLRRTVDYLRQEMRAHAPFIIVCGSGMNRNDRILDLGAGSLSTRVLASYEETGNPDGSWWAICQGAKAAISFGCEFLIHTAEDVLPHRGVMADMVWRMHNERLDYLGHLWRPQGELATQFFGCRAKAMSDLIMKADTWKPNMGPEVILGVLFGTYGVNDYQPGTRANVGIQEQLYFHSHTYADFLAELERLRR